MATKTTRLRVVKDEPEPAKPTFAECDCARFWDGEMDRPHPCTTYDLEDGEIAEAARDYIAVWETWQRIQRDPAEADARVAYAEHAARHLVGVFPNCRVSTDAFAAAAGEELGRFSADVVRLVAQHVRRSCKSLPPLAQLIELAERECRRRTETAGVLIRAWEAHAAAVRRGRAQAEEIARKAATANLTPSITAEDVLALHQIVTYMPLGIRSDHPCWTDRLAPVVLHRLASGDNAAAALVAALLAAREDERQREATAASAEERRAIYDKYDDCRRELLSQLGSIVGMPPGPSDHV